MSSKRNLLIHYKFINGKKNYRFGIWVNFQCYLSQIVSVLRRGGIEVFE